jgi:hypothetical protein
MLEAWKIERQEQETRAVVRIELRKLGKQRSGEVWHKITQHLRQIKSS